MSLQLPGANAGKPDVKGAADKAVKKSPLGFMQVEELAFDLPGSGVSKDDLPNNVKPGDAQGLPKAPTAKPPSAPSLPKVHRHKSITSSPCILARLVHGASQQTLRTMPLNDCHATKLCLVCSCQEQMLASLM